MSCWDRRREDAPDISTGIGGVGRVGGHCLGPERLYFARTVCAERFQGGTDYQPACAPVARHWIDQSDASLRLVRPI